jgi:hypothetical protein
LFFFQKSYFQSISFYSTEKKTNKNKNNNKNNNNENSSEVKEVELDVLVTLWEGILLSGKSKEFNPAIRLAVAKSIAGSGLLQSFFRSDQQRLQSVVEKAPLKRQMKELIFSLLAISFELLQVRERIKKTTEIASNQFLLSFSFFS